jgi:hypothetical protein
MLVEALTTPGRYLFAVPRIDLMQEQEHFIKAKAGLPHVGDPSVMLIQSWSGRQLGSRDQNLWCGRPVAQG